MVLKNSTQEYLDYIGMTHAEEMAIHHKIKLELAKEERENQKKQTLDYGNVYNLSNACHYA